MNMPLFPGWSSKGIASPQVLELATVFNAEGLEALTKIPDKMVRWADICTRVTAGVDLGLAKIPVRMTSMLGFKPFTGERKYHPLTLAAVSVLVNKFDLNLEWPLELSTGKLAQFYGISGVAADVVDQARALKADMVAQTIISGMTNAALGMTASAFTLPQPGLPSGLPLFSNATTGLHYANPMDGKSKRFANLYLGAGKITDQGVMGNVLTNMTQIPHPTKANMTMGNEVTDLVGGTNMLIPFWTLAMQTLSLQTVTAPANLAAATTNVFTPEMMQKASAMIGVSGLTPWRFWIAPQLDSHPYIVANPGAQMWLALSTSRAGGAYIEMAAPTKEMTPYIKFLGDGSEEAIKTGAVHLISDMAAGAAPGLPHFAQLYLETEPEPGD